MEYCLYPRASIACAVRTVMHLSETYIMIKLAAFGIENVMWLPVYNVELYYSFRCAYSVNIHAHNHAMDGI
jgi:hypothetical protein